MPTGLPEGAKALFAKQPDYRMDIYPSHRSAAAPDWVYENIFRNATRAHAAPEGIAAAWKARWAEFFHSQNGFGGLVDHLLAFGPGN